MRESRFSDKIWITRKNRINTEKRLNQNAVFSEVFIIVYSTILVILSIWNFVNPNNKVNLFLIFGSITVLSISIYISSQKFGERALAMRNHYIALDKLYEKTKRAEYEQRIDDLIIAEENYADLLSNIENHSDFDHLLLRYSERNNTNTTLPNFTIPDHVNYIISLISRYLIKLLIFITPITIVCFLYLFKIF